MSNWEPIDIYVDYEGIQLEGFALSYYYKSVEEGRTALAEEIVYIKRKNYLYSRSKKVVGYLNKFLRCNPNIFKEIDYIVPIPGNLKPNNRMRDLALFLGKIIHKPVLELLTTNEVHPSYSKGKTLENQYSSRKSKFDIKIPSNDLSKSKILLLDDVCTSGTTLIVCAKLLESVGCKDIVPFVLCTSRSLSLDYSLYLSNHSNIYYRNE